MPFEAPIATAALPIRSAATSSRPTRRRFRRPRKDLAQRRGVAADQNAQGAARAVEVAAGDGQVGLDGDVDERPRDASLLQCLSVFGGRKVAVGNHPLRPFRHRLREVSHREGVIPGEFVGFAYMALCRNDRDGRVGEIGAGCGGDLPVTSRA
jgi:hypothetical protein